MVSLVWLSMLPAGAAPVDVVEAEVSEVLSGSPESEDPCLSRRAVRPCSVLQLAVHTESGTFDAFVFSMHHAQAGVFWFQDHESGAFLKVAAPLDHDTAFLGAGWSAVTADGLSYRVERVLRETYVLRRITEGDDALAQY